MPDTEECLKEVFVGKGFLTFITMAMTTFILFLVGGSGFQHLGVIVPATLMASIFSIFLGTLVGLLSPNQMSTNLVGTPLYVILALMPMLGGMGVDVIENINVVLPTFHYFEMLELAFTENRGIGDLLPQVAVLASSAVAAFALVLLVYRKKGVG